MVQAGPWAQRAAALASEGAGVASRAFCARVEVDPSFYSGTLFCSVIFVNNFAFGPEVDHQLKERFANMKEGNVFPLSPSCHSHRVPTAHSVWLDLALAARAGLVLSFPSVHFRPRESPWAAGTR